MSKSPSATFVTTLLLSLSHVQSTNTLSGLMSSEDGQFCICMLEMYTRQTSVNPILGMKFLNRLSNAAHNLSSFIRREGGIFLQESKKGISEVRIDQDGLLGVAVYMHTKMSG